MSAPITYSCVEGTVMKKPTMKMVAVAAFCLGVTSVILSSSNAVAAIRLCGPRLCLDVWNPVTCSNGVTYSNACYAARACATGCTPGGATR